jgi:hypothetical protein
VLEGWQFLRIKRECTRESRRERGRRTRI